MKNYYLTRGFALLLVMCIGMRAQSQQFLTKIDGWNAYVHLPDDYNDSLLKKYPLICFIPGLGEIGTSASKLLVYGPSKYIAEGHNMQFLVNGKIEKPIVISMQPVNGWPNAYTINIKVDSILKRWRVDPTRVNATGLSMGGWSWNNYVDGYSPVYTNKITSIVSMSAPEPDNTISNMRHYALAGGKWWGFEGNMDLRKGDWIRDTMNKYVPASARYTLYSGGHCCWNTFYNPNYKENGESIYTWMLKQKKVSPVLPVPNTLPQANAGRDSAIVNPLTSIALNGTGNDPDGNPIQFAWKKLEGPTATISNVTNPQTNVMSLTTGTYKFELEVTDVLGAKGKDTVTIHNGNLVLPVILLNFTAVERNSQSYIQWSTSQEINSGHFEIERSADAVSFTTIGTVNSGGNSNSTRNYQFTDVNAQRGMNYYRLKMVDLDGSFAYSKIVNLNIRAENSLAFEMERIEFNNNNLRLNFYSSQQKEVSLILTDAAGRTLYRSRLNLFNGSTELVKQVTASRGLYYATISDGLTTQTMKIIHH